MLSQVSPLPHASVRACACVVVRACACACVGAFAPMFSLPRDRKQHSLQGTNVFLIIGLYFCGQAPESL